ncbi:hypothetical protein [Candidatus Villigracilis saccharophilus]|uniref:hypothetical protein n=1 Tax=Candidatus Villigracilis saccharophilus TaxID=3140684 RepID=UPI00313673C7|nr:hypothetical protein [Anaerolineales bacterium]
MTLNHQSSIINHQSSFILSTFHLLGLNLLKNTLSQPSDPITGMILLTRTFLSEGITRGNPNAARTSTFDGIRRRPESPILSSPSKHTHD